MNNLYESLLERLEGHPYNNYFACVCPFHDDHNPSMFVWEDGWFKCSACGKRGSHSFLDKHIGSHFHPASPIKSVVLPTWRKWESEYGSLEGIAEAAHKSLKRHPAF